MIEDVKNRPDHFYFRWQRAPLLKNIVDPALALGKQLRLKVCLRKLVGVGLDPIGSNRSNRLKSDTYCPDFPGLENQTKT